MNRFTNRLGLANLTAVATVSAALLLTAAYFQLSARKGMKAQFRAVNRLEGFYTSEIAALKGYHLAKSGTTAPGGNESLATTLELKNDVGEDACDGEDCSNFEGTQQTQGAHPLTLKELFLSGKIKGRSLVHRYLAGATSILPPSIQQGSDTYCGGVRFNDKRGAKTCLVEMVLPTPTPTPAPDPCDRNDPMGMITFEVLPNGSPPALPLQISDQFRDSHGVLFSRGGGGFPFIADVGGVKTAYECGYHGDCMPFTGNSNVEDGVRPGEQIGQFFLTDDGVFGTGGELVIDYVNPVDQASGGILDVDGNEVWTIRAYNSTGGLLDTKIIQWGIEGVTHNLWDGREQRFFFDRLGANDISKIVLTPNGAGNFGLGFDNFSPSKICN